MNTRVLAPETRPSLPVLKEGTVASGVNRLPAAAEGRARLGDEKAHVELVQQRIVDVGHAVDVDRRIVDRDLFKELRISVERHRIGAADVLQPILCGRVRQYG